MESRSADILCRVSARNILSVFAMRVFHESRGAKGLKGGFYATIRTANQGWVLSMAVNWKWVLFGEQFSADELKM